MQSGWPVTSCPLDKWVMNCHSAAELTRVIPQCCMELTLIPWGPATEEDSQSPPPHSTPPPPVSPPVPPFPNHPVCMCASATCGYLDVHAKFLSYFVLCHDASRFGAAFWQSLRMDMLTPIRGPTGVSTYSAGCPCCSGISLHMTDMLRCFYRSVLMLF